MKHIVLIISLVQLSSNLHCQQTDFDFLKNIPIEIEVDSKILNKYFFDSDTTINQNNDFRNKITFKQLNNNKDVLTLVLSISNSVCSEAYIFSFDAYGHRIDYKKIERFCDNGDLLGPDFDFNYKIVDDKVIIEHRLNIPCQPTKEEPYKTHYTENYITYISICNHGFFFELTERNLPKDKRLFPYLSNELVPKELLNRLTKDDLEIMRNEIYASHGYRFKTERLKVYFSEQTWYEPKYDDITEKLFPVERDNIKIIKMMEDK